MYARRLSGSLMLETCSLVAGIACSGIPNRRLRLLASMALETCLSRLAASLLTVMNMAVLLWLAVKEQAEDFLHSSELLFPQVHTGALLAFRALPESELHEIPM